MKERKFIMKLRIKSEHNPPKIGNATEEGVIATQEFLIPSDTDVNSPMTIIGFIEAEEEFMKKFCEVVTEEIK